MVLTNSNIDVMAISETHMDTTVESSDLSIDGYYLTRSDRKQKKKNAKNEEKDQRSGGLLLCTNENFRLKRRIFV